MAQKNKKKMSKKEKRNIAIGIVIAIIVAILLIVFVIIPLIQWLWNKFIWLLGFIVFFLIVCFALDS